MKTTTSTAYTPLTGEKCSCRPGVQRDNCPQCEGTGKRIDFEAIRRARKEREAKQDAKQPAPFLHPSLPPVTGVEFSRESEHGYGPAKVFAATHLGNGRRVITATARALSAIALLACLALPAHAEPCKVNVQTANAAQVAFLPGVGQITAGAIVASHPKDLAELDAVKGMGSKKMEWVAPFVTFTGPTTCTEKQKGPKAVRDGGAK